MDASATTRRAFLATALGWTGLSLLRPPVLQACPLFHQLEDPCDQHDWLDGGRLAVEGYTNQRSYVAGDIVRLHLASSAPLTATIAVHRMGAEPEMVWTGSVAVKPQTIPSDASRAGCSWERTEDGGVAFEVPARWRSGLYRITMSAPTDVEGHRSGEAWFVVRALKAGAGSRLLLVLASNTYWASNNYGRRKASNESTTEGSFYDGATTLSFLRPLPAGFLSPYDCLPGDPVSRARRFAGWDKWEWPFVRWAEREGFALEYATNEDVDRDPELPRVYQLILSVGHDEYWSARMREAFERHVGGGGNAAFFSGNVCYRRVRLDVQAAQMHLMGDMDGHALWSHRLGANRPETHLTGVSFCYGALNPAPVPYTIYQPQHWIFDGVRSPGSERDGFPQIGCIGWECDGCDLEWIDGRPIATHRDGTPEGFEILGFAPGTMYDYEATVHSKALFGLDNGFTPWGRDLRQGGAVFGTWTHGGTIVTVGCTEWARHLGDPHVARITRNILTRLG